MKRATFIVLDGADGTGKDTQAPLLLDAAKQRGLTVSLFRFPEYETETGQDISAYQRGDFGELGTTDPHLICYLYAANRFQARARLREALATCDLVIAKRYVPSNVVYGSSQVPSSERAAFQDWVMRLDYSVFENPREDAVIYLDLPVDLATTLIQNRKLDRRDINDENLSLRQTVREQYLTLSGKHEHWHVVDCQHQHSIRTIEDIQQELQRLVFDTILADVAQSKQVHV